MGIAWYTLDDILNEYSGDDVAITEMPHPVMQNPAADLLIVNCGNSYAVIFTRFGAEGEKWAKEPNTYPVFKDEEGVFVKAYGQRLPIKDTVK